MGIRYSEVYAEMQRLIDYVSKDPDLATRLTNLDGLKRDTSRTLVSAREEAAYELRAKFSIEESNRSTDISKKAINRWAHKWRVKRDLPPLKRAKREDLSGFVDLTGP